MSLTAEQHEACKGLGGLLLDPTALFLLQLSSHEMNFMSSYAYYVQQGGTPLSNELIEDRASALVTSRLAELWEDEEHGWQTFKPTWAGMYVLGSFLPNVGPRHDRHVGNRYVAD